MAKDSNIKLKFPVKEIKEKYIHGNTCGVCMFLCVTHSVLLKSPSMTNSYLQIINNSSKYDSV